jgi:glycosyltransferase involved in cell wall biosynthesis
MATDFSNFVSELESSMATNVVVDGKAGLSETKLSVANLSETTVSKTPKNVKLLIVAPDVNLTTGLSKVTHSMLQELSKISWLSLLHFSIQGQQGLPPIRKVISKVKTVNAAEMESYKGRGFGLKEFITTIQKENPTVILIYNEIGIVSGYLEELRRSSIKRTFQLWTYLDQSYEGYMQPFIDVINRDCDRVFAYSKMWRDNLKEQGVTRPVDIMNLGVDTKMYRTIPKEIARQSAGIPKDVFMFLNANKNIPRKRLDLLIIAFVKLIAKYPTKPIFLMCISDKGEKGGYQLFDIFAKELTSKVSAASLESLSNRLLLSNQQVPYKDEDMNMFYNMSDVSISASQGEGWGLSHMEAMATGVPQIVPDMIGFREYCNENNSIMIKPSNYSYLSMLESPTGGIAHVVTSDSLFAAMEKYLLENELRSLHSTKAKEVVKYSWEKAVKNLVRRMEELGDDGEE